MFQVVSSCTVRLVVGLRFNLECNQDECVCAFVSEQVYSIHVWKVSSQNIMISFIYSCILDKFFSTTWSPSRCKEQDRKTLVRSVL